MRMINESMILTIRIHIVKVTLTEQSEKKLKKLINRTILHSHNAIRNSANDYFYLSTTHRKIHSCDNQLSKLNHFIFIICFVE